VVVPASDWHRYQYLLLGGLLGPIGVVGLIITSVNAATGSLAAGVAAVVIAVALVLIGFGLFRVLRGGFRRGALIVNPHGLHWQERDGLRWTVGWRELSTTSISTAQKRLRSGSFNHRVVLLVRVDLVPGRQDAFTRYPALRELWEASGARGCYRVALGPRSGYVPALDWALRAYAPPGVYRGVIDDGVAWGFQYT